MPRENRSPFGKQVRQYRRRLGLSQGDLAARTVELARDGLVSVTVSERTIAGIEQPASASSTWRSPRMATVRSLARALELEPDTEAYDAFISAASEPPAEVVPAVTSAATTRRRSRFVAEGREAHLARLRAAIDAAAGGTAGAVFVSADPGTGKTWLIGEACRRALARHPSAVVLWGYCSAQSAPVEGGQPFRQIVRMMVGDLRTFSARQRVSPANVNAIEGRVPAAVDALLADGRGLIGQMLADAALWNGHLAELLDPELRRIVTSLIESRAQPEQQGMSLWEQLFRVLTRYAESGPVILVLDDLHWADRDTGASLLHLIQRLRGQRLPVLVLGSFRPGDLVPPAPDARHPLQPVLHEAARYFPDPILDLSTAVGGQPGRTFVEAMVGQFLGTAPRELVDYLYEKTDGLALFVSSALTKLQERGDLPRIAPEDRSLGLQALLETLPSDIDAAFAQQLSSLPESLATLLSVASVQGEIFSADVVMHILDLSDDDWFDQVDELLHQERRLVYPGGVSVVGGKHVHEYSFWHALMRDYLYGGLTGIQQTRYHRATAEALTALHGESGHEATEAIARHLELAGERQRAARAWINAGDWAYENAAYATAKDSFRRATELVRQTEDAETFAQAVIGMANAARALAQPDEAHAHVDRALAIAQRRHLPDIVANALSVKGMVEFDAGELEAGAQHQREAIEQYLAAGNEVEAGRSMANLGYLLHGMGRYDEAMAIANEGLDHARRIGNDSILIDATIALANCWIELGLYDDAIAAYEQCRVVCDDLGDVHRDNICLLNIALSCLETAQWERGEEAIRTVLHPERTTAIRLVAAAEFNMGLIAEGRGDDLEAVREHFERSRVIRVETGQNAVLIDSLAGLVRAVLQDGDLNGIEPLLEHICGYLDAHGPDGIEHYGRMFLTLVEANRALGRETDAMAYLKQGIGLLERRAQSVADPAQRESYLTNPPAHRRLMELAGRR